MHNIIADQPRRTPVHGWELIRRNKETRFQMNVMFLQTRLKKHLHVVEIHNWNTVDADSGRVLRMYANQAEAARALALTPSCVRNAITADTKIILKQNDFMCITDDFFLMEAGFTHDHVHEP